MQCLHLHAVFAIRAVMRPHACMLHSVAQVRHCFLQAIVDTVEALLPRYLEKQPLGAANGASALPQPAHRDTAPAH